MHNFQKIPPRKADVSPMLEYKCFLARKRGQRAVRVASILVQASWMNRRIDSMLAELGFRTVIRQAEDDIKQKGLDLIAECLKKGRKPSTREISRFLSEINAQ